jgi:hypothetical protein
MSYIHLPSRRLQQPRGLVRPADWVKALVDPTRMFSNSGSNGMPFVLGSAASLSDKGVYNPSTSNYGALFGDTNNQLHPRTGSFIYFCRLKVTATIGTGQLFGSTNSGTTGDNHWFVYYTYSGAKFTIRTANVYCNTGYIYSANEWMNIVFWRTGTYTKLTIYNESIGLNTFNALAADPMDYYNRYACPFGILGSQLGGSGEGQVALWAYAPSISVDPQQLACNPYELLFTSNPNRTYFDIPAAVESLITLNNGEIETLTDTNIIAPSSLGTGAAANTFLAGDGTYKSLGTLDGSVGTILNKYNYGGL